MSDNLDLFTQLPLDWPMPKPRPGAPRARYTPETADADARAARIALLVPLAERLARDYGTRGYCVFDLRTAAVRAGILTGAEVYRELSYLSAVPRAAGHRRTGTFRRAPKASQPQSHGNLNVVWVHPDVYHAVMLAGGPDDAAR